MKDWTPYRVNGSLSICFEHCGKHWQVNGVPFDLALAWEVMPAADRCSTIEISPPPH